MTVFVTGGTGFIGRALIAALVARGDAVRALARRPEALAAVAPSASPVAGDLSDPDALARAMDGCRQVYHVAAAVRAWLPDPAEYDRVNVVGTRNVLEAARRAGVERIVHTSTVMALGPSDGSVLDETAAEPVRHLSHYARTKAAAERVVAEFVGRGLDVVIVSPSLVFGRAAGARRVSFNRFMHDFLRGRPIVIPGDGSQRLNAVYLDDVVTGHLQAMAVGQPGQRYILGGENASVRQLAALVNQISGSSRRLVHVPFGLAKAAGLLDATRARLTGGTPLLTWDSVEIYRHSWAYRSDKAMRELGYRPRSLRAGIALTFAWFSEPDPSLDPSP